MNQLSPTPKASNSEPTLLDLLAVDADLFNKEFFPKTIRQESPKFHQDMDDILEDPKHRYVNFQVFRGGAKTTKIRTYIARRISYGVSKTIMVVGKNQDHAILTVGWIKRQIEKNKHWCATYGLKKGKVWREEIAQIDNVITGESIWIIAYGILGAVRGVNLDDYRPDLIVVDDVMDEENTLSQEQREKTKKLVFGALKEGLAPASEAPLAKLVICQTPLDPEDVSALASKDPEFASFRFGCWTKETENLPSHLRKSAWEARWTTQTLQNERQAAIQGNRLSIFSREKECKLTTPETATFRDEWLQYWGEDEGQEPLPPVAEMWIEIVIDPVPPPSEVQLQKGLQGKDYEAFAVVGRHRGRYFLLESVFNRGHDPSWTVAEFFRLASKWRPRKIAVEATAYQRTLAWLLRQGMKNTGRYWVIQEFVDKRAKRDKIVDGIHGVASNKQLYVNVLMHSEFISQYVGYGTSYRGPDDVIESVALCLTSLQSGLVGEQGAGSGALPNEDDIEDLPARRGAP